MLHDPTFYVTLSFILFLLLIGRPLFALILKRLDERGISIKKMIEQASRAKEDAEKFLKATKIQQKETLKQIEAIKTHSGFEAERLKSDSRKKLEQLIARSEKLTEEQIERAEKKALADIKHDVIHIAILAAENIFEKNLNEKTNDQLVEKALIEIEQLDFKLIGH